MRTVHGTPFLGFQTLAFLLTAVEQLGLIQLPRQLRDFVIKWRSYCDGITTLLHLKKLPLIQACNLLPHFTGIGLVASLNTVHHNAFCLGLTQDFRILGFISVIHMGRRIPHQENHFIGTLILTPGDIVHRCMQSCIDTLRTVAAALGPEIRE